jgi:hypothetical protein
MAARRELGLNELGLVVAVSLLLQLLLLRFWQS